MIKADFSTHDSQLHIYIVANEYFVGYEMIGPRPNLTVDFGRQPKTSWAPLTLCLVASVHQSFMIKSTEHN